MTTMLYPQLWPHSFLSLTNARHDIKYDELSSDIVEIDRSTRLKHLVSLMFSPSSTSGKLFSVFTFSSSGAIRCFIKRETYPLLAFLGDQ